MKESRLFIALVTPSPISFALSCLFALLVLLGSSWSYLRDQPFFATYLSGDYGFNSLLETFNAALSRAFDSDLSYNIAVLCFALLFGLGAYAAIASFRHMVREAQITLDEMEYADARSKQAIERSIRLRMGLRTASTLAWLGYAVFFFNGLLPYCAMLTGSSSVTATLSLRNLLAFLLLLAATHLHVIFVRLLVLRPRLFGNGASIGRGGH